MTVGNTLAYYDAAIIMAIKILVQAPGAGEIDCRA
jgi:hypothetical protein